MGGDQVGKLRTLRLAVRRQLARARGFQGLAGAALVVAGVEYLAGVGWALVSAGAFLLLGAWMTS